MVWKRTASLARLCLAGLLAALSAWLVTTAARPGTQQTPAVRPSTSRPLPPGHWSHGRQSRITLCSPVPAATRGTARSASGAISWAKTGRITSGTPAITTTAATTMSLGHATSPDGLHWTRDPANPIFTGRGSRMCASSARTARTSCSPRGRRHRAPAHLARRSRLGRPRVARHPHDHRHTDQPRALRHADGLVRERHVVSFLRTGRPGCLAGNLEGPPVWTNVQDDPVLAMGPEPYDKTPWP